MGHIYGKIMKEKKLVRMKGQLREKTVIDLQNRYATQYIPLKACLTYNFI